MANFTFKDLNSIINTTNNGNNIYATCSIDEKELMPRKSTINNILGYSKSLSVRKSKHLSEIKMILN